MDAKITKQRLGNLLSYDWLKILAVIAAAIALLSVFFTMVRTRPSDEQVFTVFGYQVLEGSSAEVDRSEFSYEILKTGKETFNSSTAYLFSVRRSVNEGSVMFISDLTRNAGEENESNDLLDVTGGVAGAVALDTEKYLADCKNYLIGFFGGELKEENLNGGLVRETFLARNGKDKRFRSAAKKEEGVVLETARLKKLRNDYLAVEEALTDGRLVHNVIETEAGGTVSIAFKVGGLDKINRVYDCGEEDGAQTSLNLVILNNNNPQSDLRYEPVSYLRYLVENFG